MADLGRSFVIAIYGDRPSFDPAAGEVMALVACEAGADEVLVDRERNRVCIAATPARRDLDRWTGPVGLILAARRGAWGLSIVEDHYAGESTGPARPARRPRPWWRGARAPREPVPSFGSSRRASIPGDLCSCLRCRDLVIARRPPGGGPALGLAAPGRLFRRIARALGDVPAVQGPGAAAVEHGRDCLPFRMADPGPIPGRKARRARGLRLARLLRLLRRDPVGRAWLTPARKGVAL